MTGHLCPSLFPCRYRDLALSLWVNPAWAIARSPWGGSSHCPPQTSAGNDELSSPKHKEKQALLG